MTAEVEKSRWPKRPLIDVAKLQRGFDLPVQDRVEGDVPVFAANGPIGTHSEAICKGPGVVTGRSGTIGKVHYIDSNYWPLNTSLFVVDFCGNYPKWVYYMLEAFRLDRFAQGAGVPTLNRNLVHGELVSVPPIAEQKRIAAILDKADSLRRKRREAIVLVDDFLRAVFFELFGDPNVNDKRWPERAIADISKVTTGSTPPREVAAYYGDAIEWIKSDNINTPSHWLTHAREGLSELGTSIARTVPAGSTLMTCIAGSASCIGNVALSDRKVAFNQQINAMTPAFGIEPEFLYGLLLYSKPRIQATSTNSMKGMVSKGVLEKVNLIWPPADLQKKFVKIFKHVERLRSRMEDAEASTLIAALQSKLLE